MENQPFILMVYKNQELQLACRKALTSDSFSLRFAASLSAVEDWAPPPELVLLDVGLLSKPAEADLLRNMCARDPEFVCIILSNRSSLNRALRGIADGAHDLVLTPIIPEMLSLRVKRAFERRRAFAELKRLHVFEQDVSRLWSVAKGELETADIFDKDFLVPTAFRLTVAHEFRAPLAALQSYLQLVLKGYVPLEQQADIIKQAIDRSQDLLMLVDDLMNLATARDELANGTRAQIPLGEELDKALTILRVDAEDKGLRLIMDIRSNPWVAVNPAQIRQVWNNLVSNAIKYTPSGGYVLVLIDQNEEEAIGIVEDNGIGIAAEEKSLIFNEFYRTARARQMERPGTGLGLPLVKRIVEGYGGRVEVESSTGKGSLFRFTLPLNATVPDQKVFAP